MNPRTFVWNHVHHNTFVRFARFGRFRNWYSFLHRQRRTYDRVNLAKRLVV